MALWGPGSGVPLFLLLHGATGAWDEVIFLALLGAFILSLVLRFLANRSRSKKRDQ